MLQKVSDWIRIRELRCVRFRTRHFAQVTRENVGRPFAMVLDNEVISAPVIREPIVTGSGKSPATLPFSKPTISPFFCAPARCHI